MTNPVDSPRALLTVCYLTAVGAFFFNTQPVVLGAFADSFGFDERQLGALAGTGLLAAFVVVVSAFHWVPRVSWRSGVALGVGSILVACACLALTRSYPGALLGVALLGFGSAAAYAPALAALAAARDPIRAFGLAIVAQASLAAISVLLIPAWLVPTLGFAGLTGYLALVAGLALVLLPLVPDRPEVPSAKDADVEAPPPGARGARLAWAGLAAMAVYFVGLNGTWAFLERIGVSAGLSGQVAGFTLAISMLVGASGAGAASALGERVSVPAAMAACTALFVLFVALVADAPGAWRFGSALLVFNVAWNFSMPFQMDVVARADGLGRFVVLVPAAQTVGGALGPALSGPLLIASGTPAVYAQLLVCVVAACVAYVALDRRIRFARGPR